MGEKSPDAFRTISEVSEALRIPAHVLRFWESRFSQIRPVKGAGGRRYYRPEDVDLIAGIKRLLHDHGMTIRGVQKLLKDHGVAHVAALGGEAGDAGPLSAPFTPPPGLAPAPRLATRAEAPAATVPNAFSTPAPLRAASEPAPFAPLQAEALPAPAALAPTAEAPPAEAGHFPLPRGATAVPPLAGLLARLREARPVLRQPEAARLRPVVARLALLRDRLAADPVA